MGIVLTCQTSAGRVSSFVFCPMLEQENVLVLGEAGDDHSGSHLEQPRS